MATLSDIDITQIVDYAEPSVGLAKRGPQGYPQRRSNTPQNLDQVRSTLA
ncbi:hypothetical protein QJS66_01225 [Kocuria rhizophila]|nr:hypothetical protein QJS66_01225 [Kocuria rhizophila]